MRFFFNLWNEEREREGFTKKLKISRVSDKILDVKPKRVLKSKFKR